MGNKFQTIFNVGIPDFSGKDIIFLKVKRVSLLGLAANDKIPKELIPCATSMFSMGGQSDVPIDELGKVIVLVVKESLIEPTYATLEKQGIMLTDEQLAILYAFATCGPCGVR